MSETEQLFKDISKDMCTFPNVAEGTMMSAQGIQYKGKNFAFIYREKIAFRLVRDFDPASEGIHKFELLNPFIHKPPLKDWFVIGEEYADKWPILAQIAYQKMSGS